MGVVDVNRRVDRPAQAPIFEVTNLINNYTMYYAKQKIYETPLFDVVAVSTETGFAGSKDGIADTESLTEKVYQWQ